MRLCVNYDCRICTAAVDCHRPRAHISVFDWDGGGVHRKGFGVCVGVQVCVRVCVLCELWRGVHRGSPDCCGRMGSMLLGPPLHTRLLRTRRERDALAPWPWAAGVGLVRGGGGVWPRVCGGGGFEANHLASVSQMAPGNKWPKWTYGTGVEGKIGSRISWPRGGYGMTTVWLEEGGGRGIQKRGLLRCTSRSGGVAMARSRVCLVSHPTLPRAVCPLIWLTLHDGSPAATAHGRRPSFGVA